MFFVALVSLSTFGTLYADQPFSNQSTPPAKWLNANSLASDQQAEESAGIDEATVVELVGHVLPTSGPFCDDSCLPPVTDRCDSTSSCDSCGTHGLCGKDGWLSSDEPLLKDYRNQTLFGDVKYSVGGELRYRYMDEHNRLRPQGAARRDTYQLWRFTPFMEVGNDWIKGYVQGIDASAFDEDLPILPIDENRWDLLQYYVDARLIELDGGDVRGQLGRIFLNYGDQHLISPLGWANTYRNFEGAKLYYSGDDWSIDGFVVRPNNGAAAPSVFRPQSFDQPDQSVVFSGIYATYKKAPNGTVDLFWLWNKEDQPFLNRQDGNRHTLGARYAGTKPVKNCETTVRTYMWDLQGAWQFGTDDFGAGLDQDVNAGFLSAISGVTFNEVRWSPSIKGVFWWGSGDDDPNDNNINTVNTLYPLGHAYWGLIDNFNGANLLDYSIQASVKPADKVTLAAHMHWFEKANENDFVYNIAGAPLGNTTTNGRHIGNELDLLATYQVNNNLQLQAGYFWFWYGDAVDNQAALARDDAHQFYFMTTWGF